ncbi:MAG: stage III sporulation protein AA, partial [Blautia sp.]|nr:stage III sporulation protein AA [Blautia sp.]
MKLQNYLPMAFRSRIDDRALENAEEIRLRVGQPLEILYADEESRKFDRLDASQLREMLNYLSGYSVYAIEEELRQGFFTVEGGHRVGVSGRTSYQKKGRWNEMNPLSDISGLNIRLAHERKGCAKQILPWIRHVRSIYHTFIFASPGVGKTTYLRDCIRSLSKGDATEKGLKIGVVDERSEIAACHRGVPQNDLGPRTDVLDNCPKEQGMKMLLRSMSPEVIAVDELGLPEDFAA